LEIKIVLLKILIIIRCKVHFRGYNQILIPIFFDILDKGRKVFPIRWVGFELE